MRFCWACLETWARWVYRPERMTRGHLGPSGQRAEDIEPDKTT